MTGQEAAGPLAQCVAVSRQFGEFTAVRDVDLRVDPGEIVGLLGANGAGKTTLIRLLLGLLATSAGEVALFGEPPSRRTRRRIGYVPQSLGLYDDLTVSENLKFSAAVFGSGASGPPVRPASAEPGGSVPSLASAGPGGPASPPASASAGPGTRAGRSVPTGLPGPLRPYATALAGGLSLGVQRRVAFVQALAHQPDLLILDEPTSGVDPLGRARLWETVSAAADRGVGVLVTTHYMEEAQECGRLVIMADGAIVAEGTAADIVGDARVTVVEASSWTAAFGKLEHSGMAVALAGRTLRVPGGSPEAVQRALGDAEARVYEAPATLEERFFQLVLPQLAAGAPA